MTDRNLEESIYQMQKLNTENGIKQLVEEAAQLYADGRHMEAGALMEKAEAMLAVTKSARVQSAPPPSATSENGRAERSNTDEQVIAAMAAKLGDDLSKILLAAFQDLQVHILAENSKLSTSFEQQLARLQSAVNSLGELESKFEQITEAVSEQRSVSLAIGHKCDQLSHTVASLQDASSHHNTGISTLHEDTRSLRSETATLRAETAALREEVSIVVFQQVEGLAARLGLQQEELSGLKGTVSEISRKIAGYSERLDRQAEIIRSLSDTQSRRAEALDELVGILARLKANAQPLVTASAGQF